MHIKYLNYKKRVVRVKSGVGPRSSPSSLFRKLNILPVACQYMLSLMFIVDKNTLQLMHKYTV